MDLDYIQNAFAKYSDEPFSKLEYIYIPDSNNGSYTSGQVMFDGSGLSNNQNWILWYLGYVMMPVGMSCSASTLAEKAYACAFKNGSYQMVNNITLNLSGKSVVNNNNYINALINYKMMTQTSTPYLRSMGSIINFDPDTSDSYLFDAVETTALAYILRNNQITQGTQTLTGAWVNAKNNSGLMNRTQRGCFEDTSVTLTPTTASASGLGDNRPFSYNSSNVQYYYMTMIIPLAILHDIFNQMDFPVKHLYPQLWLNCNVGAVTCTATSTVISAISTSVQGNTFPAMLTDVGFTATAGTSSRTPTITVSIGKFGASTTNTPISQCRLYVPIIKIKPSYEAELLSHKSKVINYLDFQSFYQVAGVSGSASSSSLTYLISNGIPNLKNLIVMPFASASTNTQLNGVAVTATSTISVNPLLNPLDSAPSTTCPQVYLSNINIALGGENYFSLQQQYGYEMFENQIRQFLLNQGSSPSICSGLLNSYDWNNNYKYYAFNLSRNSAGKDVPQSIMFQATVQSGLNLDFLYLVEQAKQITLNCVTGEVSN